MALTTSVRRSLNGVLALLNLRLDTLTAERRERERLERLRQRGQFDKPVFPVPSSFASMAYRSVLEAVGKFTPRFADFRDAARNDVGYTYNNGYFSSPDTEVLYAIVRHTKPRTIIEVGSGHSTRVIRQALLDGQLDAELVSIDPRPRLDVRHIADRIVEKPVEDVLAAATLGSLEEGDILFVDSSHCLVTGGDLVALYLHALPELKPGVLVHVHDIFLPYDYSWDWVTKGLVGVNEQYLLQAILTYGDSFEVLWPGHFLQRSLADFAESFPYLDGRVASSMWLRKVGR